MLSSAAESALSLDFKPTLHFSGSTVQGTVSINLNEARSQEIKCVRVKLRGDVNTIVYQYTGYSVNPIPGHREFVRQDLELWTPGSTFPPQGDVLTLPFNFEMPLASLPPSNASKSSAGTVCCRYKVEVVGDREGMLKRNRRHAQAFPFLPDDTPGWRVKQQLQSGPWVGQWKTEVVSDQLRQVLWHDHAQVVAKLHLPDVPSLPLSTAIPFKLEIQTQTRPLKEKDVSKKESDDHLFPYPAAMADINLDLKTRHKVKTGSGSSKWRKSEELFGLTARWHKTEDLCEGNCHFTEDRAEPQTNPSGDKFVIEQRNTISGSFILHTTSPSYETDIHVVTHELLLKVPFKGLTNNLNITLPVQVSSGCSAQDAEHAEYEMLPDYYDIADSDDEDKGGDKKK